MAPTLRELYETYIRDNHTIQQATKDRAGRAFRPLMMLLGPDTEAREITRAAGPAYQAILLKTGKSPATVNSYAAQVSAVFGWHVGLDLLPTNPLAGLKPVRIRRKKVDFYEPDTLPKLLGAIDSLHWRDPTARLRLRGIFLLAYHMALRIGEIINLRWLDIDLDKAVIKVQYRACKLGEWWEWGDKGFQDRELPIESQEVLEHYYRMKVVCPWMYPHLPAQRCKKLQRQSDRLPEHRCKRPDNNLYRQLNRIKKVAGITDGAVHKWRRTALTESAPFSSPSDLKAFAGHKSIKTTMDSYVGIEESALMERLRQAQRRRCHANDQ